jgi:hypothetical protein
MMRRRNRMHHHWFTMTMWSKNRRENGTSSARYADPGPKDGRNPVWDRGPQVSLTILQPGHEKRPARNARTGGCFSFHMFPKKHVGRWASTGKIILCKTLGDFLRFKHLHTIKPCNHLAIKAYNQSHLANVIGKSPAYLSLCCLVLNDYCDLFYGIPIMH